MNELAEMKHIVRPKRRGWRGQCVTRQMEHLMRRSTTATAVWLTSRGRSCREIADGIGMSEATVRSWARGWEARRLQPLPVGRPIEDSCKWLRQQILGVLGLVGAEIGVPALQEMFPEAARRELEDLHRRYQDVHHRKGMMVVHALRWTMPGTVWAMDYTQAPAPIDGRYPYVLLVRDLASGRQLQALPVEEATALETVRALQLLLTMYERPLVIKCDNGSHFAAEEVRRLLRERGILQLFSPPCTPEYNGACEAGVGSLATRAHHEAARHDRTGEWTCDDVEAARSQANQTARPQGLHGPTPDDLWRRCEPLSELDRQYVRRQVERLERKARAEHGFLPDVKLSTREQDGLNRVAIGWACVELGLVLIRRKRIPVRVKRWRVRRVS